MSRKAMQRGVDTVVKKPISKMITWFVKKGLGRIKKGVHTDEKC